MRLKVSRPLLLLGALGVVLTVVVMARRADDAATDPGRSSGRSAATTAATKQPPVADLKLERLKADDSELGPSTRNPFQFKPKAAPPSPASRSQARAAAPPVVIAPPPVPQGPPPPPPIALKYIGVLETAQGRMAIFRDSGGDIVNGKEGDIIDGRYRLLKIGVESADLAYVDGRGRQTIRLSGQ
jgi:hypothetical protein